MSSGAAAAAAAGNVTDEDVRLYLAQSVDDFNDACKKGYAEHKFEPVTAGLKIGNHVMTNLINKCVTNTQQGQLTQMNNTDLFTMVAVLAKTNVGVQASLDRAQFHEKMTKTLTSEVNKLKETLIETEEKVNNQANAEEVLNKMAEMMKGTGGKGGIGQKPVSEHKAIQQLKTFTGDRSKFREWNEKLLNALGQVNVKNRKALKYLNAKLETLDGALKDVDDDDMLRILNNRLTQEEYDNKASAAERKVDDDKGDYEFPMSSLKQLEEDLWYIFNDKLEGQEPRGKIKGLHEGDGLTAYQKIYKWYSAVTGVTLSGKMNLAMNPDKPKKITDVSNALEQWSALVEGLEKYGNAYSLNLPFRVTALRVIMGHASDWFDSWQHDCYKTPDALTYEAYQKLYRKCEDWARRKRLDADSNNVNQEIGGVDDDGENEDPFADVEGDFDEYGNWGSNDGDFWPADPANGGETNEVTKGKGKGKGNGPQCYNCGGWGHIGRNCPNRGAGKGAGGGKGGYKGGGTGGKGYGGGGKGAYQGGGYKGYQGGWSQNSQGGWTQGGRGNQGYQGGGKGGYGGAKGYQGGGKGGYQGGGKGWYQAGGGAATKGGGKGSFVPHSERDCYKCGGRGHIALNCPGALTRSVQAQGGPQG